MKNYQCLNCLQPSTLIHVHGHYQCSRCGMNMLPCCDGDNCSTNWLLQRSAETAEQLPMVRATLIPPASVNKDLL